MGRYRKTASSFGILNEAKRQELISQLQNRINKTIKELSNLQRETDEESLIRQSELTQERDRLLAQLNEVLTSKAVDQNQKNVRGVVNLGDTVKIRNGDTLRTLDLVGDYEADSINGQISVRSPLGRVLLNKAIGDKITFQTPAGQEKIEILEVS